MDLPDFKTTGERIAWWRERRNMSRTALAKAAHMPYSTLAGIEDGDQRKTTNLPQLAAALRLSVSYLDTGKGDPEDPTALSDSGSWPFAFPQSVLSDLNPIEFELAEMKLLRLIEDIKSKRSRGKKTG